MLSAQSTTCVNMAYSSTTSARLACQAMVPLIGLNRETTGTAANSPCCCALIPCPVYVSVIQVGYSLNALVDFAPDDPISIIKHLMVGSEGTLGFISNVTYKCVPQAPHSVSTRRGTLSELVGHGEPHSANVCIPCCAPYNAPCIFVGTHAAFVYCSTMTGFV